ncbi:trans-L-3-hydroxyproline dehydratase-like [Pecten maximus]|uniref:trans-L-3-hydroxyproline dehydratase-like n=1 Tax=Pecten maximus TaxID=6579 RepID=UPI001458C5A2|nr:trans-L-3-hydroxyproline dehydratase-like [Pecten maximus]
MSEVPEDVEIRTKEMHTGGEPLRVIESGFPSLGGDTILDKIRFIRENFDAYRKFLMYEPRGHYDMYGALVVPADNKKADIATIFMHNEGYSTMCGHAVIALGRYAVDSELVRNPSSPETRVAISGVGNVSVDIPEYGNVTVDIVYGGAFYAFVADAQYNFRLGEVPIQEVRNAAGATTGVFIHNK